MRWVITSAALTILAHFSWAAQATWRAGVAKVSITPEKSLWLTGYGSRNQPSTGVINELYVKVLALEDGSGKPIVLVCADVLGLPGDVGQRIAERVRQEWGLRRDRILLNSSHTHCGPSIAHPGQMLYGPRATDGQRRDVEQYTASLETKVVAAVAQAMATLGPAKLRYGHARANFGMNRRLKTDKGFVIGENPAGPVDHDVPLLVVESPGGKTRAIVFGYACHNTTIGGDVYQFCGDYAGFAAEELEKSRQGTVAMFVQGCGGDINPSPRGTVDLARQHGKTLADAVELAIGSTNVMTGGPVRSAYETVPIGFAASPTRQELTRQLEHKDIYFQWQARELLKVMEHDGKLPSQYAYPVQVWQFGKDLTLITLAGEVVVDYSIRLKSELGADRTWVAGYCNDVFAYIPSRRVLEEGGYEAAGAMVYYVHPGPFVPTVEETIVAKVRELVNKAQGNDGSKP